jgi:hypothetical protein
MRCLPKKITQAVAVATLVFAAAAPCRAQTEMVHKIDWSKYAKMRGVQSGDRFGQKISQVLQKQSRYLFDWVHSQYTIEKNLQAYQGIPFYSPPLKKGFEGSIRPLAQFAWSNAALLKTGIFNSAVAGLSESEALERTEMAIRGVAMTHRANKKEGETWGQGLPHRQSWQAAYWASQAAEPAWMLWDDLSQETKEAVAKMVEFEAHGLMDYKVPYWRSPSGKTNTPGDTKAEENAWNSRILAVAQAMMPNHPNVARWREKASELMVGSYDRQSDLANEELVDGKPVKQWVKGYNTFNDGVAVNHGRAHPSYMAAHAMTYSTAIDAALAGQYIPQSAFFNAQLTWDAMTKLNFVAGADPYGTGKNLPPGGTIYHRKADGSLDPTPYFPSGNDWSKNPSADVDYVLFDVYSGLMKYDAGQSLSAMDWANAQVDALRDLQNRPGHKGNLYQPGDWNDAGDELEIVTYQDLAEAWMVWWLNQHQRIPPIGDHWGMLPNARH